MAQSPQTAVYRPQMSPMNMMSKILSFKDSSLKRYYIFRLCQ
jgi:hypothetical protein